jgi:two-component system sensor histidine kinase/response regulator
MTVQAAHSEVVAPHKPMATILVVDDESVIRELCEKALKGYTVFKAGSCRDALRIYTQENVDLVLTDVMMPGGTGLDLLRKIKEFDLNASVIIMTGFSEKDVILGALKDGADDFISKPLNLLQLKTSVEKALVRKSLKEELANLKNLDRLKSNFLSLISHKLRTPITTISLFLQNIQRGIYEPKDASFLKNVNLINDEAIYLSRMVTDLLNFSQVMEGIEGLNREPCDLNLIAASVVYGSQEAQLKPGIETDFQEVLLPLMSLDRLKITFALQRIVDNAYKFSSELGTVSVSLFNGGDHVCVLVSDTGVGMPHEEIPKVFEKFYQIDPHNTGQVKGFGLGLFYAREFVHQHGGSVSMASEPGLGTTVTVTLPLQ